MRHFFRTAVSVLLLYPAALKAQDMTSFEIIQTPGDSMRTAGDMIGAITAYKKSIAGGNIYAADDQSADHTVYCINIYNLACAYSRTGQQDSALKYLQQYVQDYDSSAAVLSDPDLILTRTAAGWPKLEKLLIKNYCSKKKIRIKDPAYAKKLWYMSAADQAYYSDINIAEEKTGKTSSVVLALWDLKRKLNEENQQRLETLIKEKGWPKISETGEGPAMAAFLVIQHADLAKQQKYLPTIENLCKTGEARWQDYALMYDRIQTSTGKAQRYGSQVRYNDVSKKYELFPLEDPAKVDEWRKAAALQPLSAYLKNWDIVWP